MDLARETLLQIEELAANAVAATTVQLVDGWLLRAWPDAPFRRPNSVLPIRGTTSGLDARLALVEDFYRRRALPARFQLGAVVEPPFLEERLAARGYVIEAASVVQIASVADVRAATAGEPHDGVRIEVADHVGHLVSPEWIAAYARAHGDDAMQMRRIAAYGSLLAHLGPSFATALARSEAGDPLAAGFVVVERGWGGIFGMGTRPEARRRRLARAILHALAVRAAAFGASRLYLQVEADNEPALALYAGAGFARAFGYHYRSLALAGA